MGVMLLILDFLMFAVGCITLSLLLDWICINLLRFVVLFVDCFDQFVSFVVCV